MSKFFNKLQDKVQKHMGKEGGDNQGGGPAPPSSGTPTFTFQTKDGPRPVIPQPGQKPPGPGQMPPKVANLQYTDSHKFYHPSGRPHDTLRDLGFTGVLDGQIVWSWGDTLMGNEDRSMICAVDSTSIGSMNEPMASMDTALAPHSDNVRNWIPTNHDEESRGGYSEWSFGGTNIVEVGPNKGIVYYLKIHRPGGNAKIQGAGVATCEMGRNGVPTAHRPHDMLWRATEPAWGDVGICLDERDGNIYSYGHGPEHDQEFSSRTYLCRCPKDRATDVSAYEYWDNGAGQWRRERFGDGKDGTVQITQDMAVFGWHAMNQSAPFWSNHFNKWMLLHGSGWPNSEILCKTADKLEGPWEDHGSVAKTDPNGNEQGFRYCYCGHPEFDETGKKVLTTWTRNNVIFGVWIEWQ